MPLWRFPERVRAVMAETLTHHWTEMLQFKRAAYLKSMGMDQDQQVTRFPPSSMTIQSGGVTPLLVTAASMLAAGAGGAMLMDHFRGNDPATMPQPPITPPPAVVTPAEPMPTPKITVEDQSARVVLYYDDPVKGLVPIAGAADQDGATIQPKTKTPSKD